MKALVKADAEPGLTLEEIEEPTVGREDVLIRVLYTGICGTDLHIYNWDRWASENIRAPIVVGHEFVGRIEACGDDVHGLAAGELVSGEGHIVCGRCRNCMAGRRVQCAHTVSLGINRPGAFAEYVVMPASNIWTHSPGIDLEVAAIFDAFGNAVHAALAFPVLCQDVAITGAGPIGLIAAAVVRHSGARHVVITDPSEYRLDLARHMGVTLAVNASTTSLADAVASLGMKEGFDVAMEMAGSPAALQDLLSAMCHGGQVAMLGLPNADFAIDWGHLVVNMISIKGIYGREMFETWYQMSVLVESGLDISPVITHRFAADEYEGAFATLASGRCGKIVLSWAGH